MAASEQGETDLTVSNAAARYGALTAAIRELIKVMHEGSIGRLEVEHGDLRISLTARGAVPEVVNGNPFEAPAVTAAIQPAQPAPDTPPAEDNLYVITSPMIGTFYAAPDPGDRPFVQVGDTVDAGQAVAIIEAMKIMNEIVSEHSGVVDTILVTNGETVEYGHPLMRLRPLG
jgi:acetyl-CoA carboxylase biotin carboxyl carrier protein